MRFRSGTGLGPNRFGSKSVPVRNRFRSEPVSIRFRWTGSGSSRSLWQYSIAKLLQKNNSVTLSEVIEIYPIKNGLAEVITYFSIATKSDIHQIDGKIKETIPWENEEEQRLITLPQVIFIKEN